MSDLVGNPNCRVFSCEFKTHFLRDLGCNILRMKIRMPAEFLFILILSSDKHNWLTNLFSMPVNNGIYHMSCDAREPVFRVSDQV